MDFLQNDLIPALAVLYPNEDDPNILNDTPWYQQDGAPPHYMLPVRNFLHTVLPERWIGRRGPIEWPARSPDLTTLDFFLWGYLKSKVYDTKPENVKILKRRIEEIRKIGRTVINNVLDEFVNRLSYFQEANGWHFEHLI